MKILITGGTGYIGTTLVPYLQERGYNDICLLVRDKAKAQGIYADSVQYISTADTEWREQLTEYNNKIMKELEEIIGSRFPYTMQIFCECRFLLGVSGRRNKSESEYTICSY